jgi:hypothetical protein
MAGLGRGGIRPAPELAVTTMAPSSSAAPSTGGSSPTTAASLRTGLLVSRHSARPGPGGTWPVPELAVTATAPSSSAAPSTGGASPTTAASLRLGLLVSRHGDRPGPGGYPARSKARRDYHGFLVLCRASRGGAPRWDPVSRHGGRPGRGGVPGPSQGSQRLPRLPRPLPRLARASPTTTALLRLGLLVSGHCGRPGLGRYLARSRTHRDYHCSLVPRRA